MAQHRALLFALLLLLCGVLLYWPLLGFSFFWEDPFDIGQVDEHTFVDLFRVSTNNQYYRPLFLVLVKSLKGSGDVFRPLPFYLFNVATRIGAAYLVYRLGRKLFHRQAAAEMAGLLFLVAPIAYDSTAKAMSAHQPLAPLVLLSLLLYWRWRRDGNRLLLGLALLAEAAALLTHEYALLLPFMLLCLEIWLVIGRRATPFRVSSLLFLLPAALYVLVWFSIPKADDAVTWRFNLDSLLFLTQGVSFPLAGFAADWIPNAVAPRWQLVLAGALTTIVLAAAYRRRPALALLLLSWFGMAVCLPLLMLSNAYLQSGSQRLFYFPLIAASLLWAGGIDAIRLPRFRAAYAGFLFVILIHAVVAVAGLNRAYTAGSNLMRDIVAVGETYERALFINVPDRYEYCDKLYPVGFWGMMFAPVSQELDDFIFLHRGISTETVSLSSFIDLFPQVAQTPYCVNWRGDDAYGTPQLRAAFLAAEQVFVTRYNPDGTFDLLPVGRLLPAVDADPFTDDATIYPVQFGAQFQLLDATVARHDEDDVCLTTTWRRVGEAAGRQALFVHLMGRDGALLAQRDGDALGDLLPPSQWRTDRLVIDTRCFLDQTAAAPAYFNVGLYERSTGQRLPARLPDGGPITDDIVQVPITE